METKFINIGSSMDIHEKSHCDTKEDQFDKNHLPQDDLSEFIFKRTYSRFIPSEGRREEYHETVTRIIRFLRKVSENKLPESDYKKIEKYLLKKEVFPSMRLMQFAGDAAEKDNCMIYNCGYIDPTDLDSFAEIMYLLMNGCGIGFSVEDHIISKLPVINVQNKDKVIERYIIPDSTEGWCDALKKGLHSWKDGSDIEFDFSEIRPKGSRMKTKGSYACGPEALNTLLTNVKNIILKRQGNKLRSIDVLDIICFIGNILKDAGLRRSALISFSDLLDADMRQAKYGSSWFEENFQRSGCNNSVCYKEKPDCFQFMTETLSMIKSRSGERGMYNPIAALNSLPQRRKERLMKKFGITEKNGLFSIGLKTNPCGEALLLSRQFCNLTCFVGRKHDTVVGLLKKAELAAIIGTIQSSLTNFSYISKEWKENCELDRLLGVSPTGIADCQLLRNEKVISMLKDHIVNTNKKYADILGINSSSCTTAVKPSGTSSLLAMCSPGIHYLISRYYIRRIRSSVGDPLTSFYKDQGVPYKHESHNNSNILVFEFPCKTPKSSITIEDVSALDQLKLSSMYTEHYTEHNTSCTVSTGDDEWPGVMDYLWNNFDKIIGITFLPRDNTVYELAPFEKISEEKYNKLVQQFPKIDYNKFAAYEKIVGDKTQMMRISSCSGGKCDL